MIVNLEIKFNVGIISIFICWSYVGLVMPERNQKHTRIK